MSISFCKENIDQGMPLLISVSLCILKAAWIHCPHHGNVQFVALNNTFHIRYMHAIILDCPVPMPAPVLLFISGPASNGI